MNDQNIELPPLPMPAIRENETALYGAFAGSQMQDYARAAIEADRKQQYRPVYEEGWKDALEWAKRQRGGEPVGTLEDHLGTVTWHRFPQRWPIDLYLAPQPAEPVKVPSADAIADIVRDHLTAAYICNRVWEAWSYNTMGPDDFIEASETEMADEIAAAIVARYGQPAPQDGEYEACPMQYVEKTEPRDDDWAVAAKDGMMVHGGLQRKDALLIAAALNAYGQPAQPAESVELTDLGPIRVGNLPTVNQDEYPGLGDWWVQLRIGNDGDEVLARVYGDTPEQARSRAFALAAPVAAQPPYKGAKGCTMEFKQR